MEEETEVDGDTCRTALLQLSKRFNVPISVLLNPMDPALEVILHTPVVPVETQNMILGHLGLEDLRSFRTVSKSWNELICSNHLQGVSPVVVFNLDKEIRGKDFAKFLDLMENKIQTFPFSRFSIDLNGGIEPIIRFAEKYGSQITELILKDGMTDEVEEELPRKLTTMVQSLLSNTQNLESFELKIYEDFLSPDFTFTTHLPKLKRISVCPGCCGEGKMMDSLASAFENLEEIQIILYPARRKPDLHMSTMVYKLKKLQHFRKVVLSCRRLPLSQEDAIRFFNLLQEVPLQVQELKVVLEAKATHQNLALRQLIESLSPTLKSLSLLERNEAEWSPSKEMELPFLEHLEKLILGSLDWLERLKPRPLQSPGLVSLGLTRAKVNDLRFILTEMTYLEELHISFNDKDVLQIFLGLWELRLADEKSWLHGPLDRIDDPLPSLVNMTRLRSLMLSCTCFFHFGGIHELRMITFLSATKKLKRLCFLGLYCLKLDWETQWAKEMCARLRECHEIVEVGDWKDPREEFSEDEDGYPPE